MGKIMRKISNETAILLVHSTEFGEERISEKNSNMYVFRLICLVLGIKGAMMAKFKK